MDQARRIIDILADGSFHSGETLGDALGMTRSGIWKVIKQCENYGVDIESVHGRGYRIPGGIEMLSADDIKAILSPKAQALLTELEIYETIDSTNSYLLERAKTGSQSGTVVVSEQQTAGRGRRGRHWVSPFGTNIYTSILWSFHKGPNALAGLSIVAGIAIVRALERYGLNDLKLKWPNDIVWHGRKLGGVLVEMFVDSLGICYAILGVGLNVQQSRIGAAQIQQPWVDVREISAQKPRRNYLLGLVLDELLSILPEFEISGLTPFIPEWEALDSLRDKTVTVETLSIPKVGIAQGIDSSGGLKVQIQGKTETFYAGEVSVRSTNT